MGYDDVSLGKKKDENFDYKFAFDVKSEDDTNLSFYPINTSYPVIDLHAYSEHSLFFSDNNRRAWQSVGNSR
ncbi:hypothetical protein [Escherichia sp. E1130]|uniref:hypothetical protein n=1 Tax=Escherichia sp. E1130 TaxID=2041645 RepID=UPI001080D324|nr:hypothetical protein [Escherichia sp. E1130]